MKNRIMWLVIIILIFLFVCLGIFIIYSNNDKTTTTVDEDLYRLQEYFINGNNLQRMLMIEILTSKRRYTNYNALGSSDIVDYTSSKSDDSLLVNSQTVPENTTYNRILVSLKKLSICLTRYLGGTLSKRLVLLLQRRHEILRDFYVKLNKNIYSNESYQSSALTNRSGSSFRNVQSVWASESYPKRPEVDKNSHEQLFSLNNSSALTNESCKDSSNITQDIITDTLSKLKHVSEMIITDIKSVICNNRDISYYNIHYRHLLDLFNMYDIEMLNQAKSYNIGDYNTSLNNFNGSKVISEHISDELKTILKYNQKQLTINIS